MLKIITILTLDSPNIICDLFFYFCFLVSLLILKVYSFKQIVFFVLAALYSLIYFSSEKRNLFLLFVIASFILISCSYRNFLKTTLMLSIITFLLVSFLVLAGEAKNLWFKDFDGSLFYNFGFNNPNTFSMFFFSSTMCFLLLFRKSIGKIIDIVFIFLSFLVFKITGCNTLIVCTFLLYIVYFLIKHIHFKFVMYFCLMLPVLVTLILTYLALNVKNFLFIDVFLTGRLSLYNTLFSHSNFFGVIFGNPYFITTNKITLDNAYFGLIFIGGIISFLIFLHFYFKFVKSSFENKRWFPLSIVITYLFYGIMESVFTNILLFPNFVFWILILNIKPLKQKRKMSFLNRRYFLYEI